MTINDRFNRVCSGHAQAYLKLTIMSLFLGGIFIAGRMMADEIPPVLAALIRFLIASVCLLGLLYWQERRFPIPSKTECFGLICLGLTGISGYNLLILQALQTVEAGRSAVLVSCNPVLITLLSCVFLGERLTCLKTTGIMISVSGALLVASKGDMAILLNFSSGDKAVLGAMLCWAVYSIIGKQLLKTMTPITAVTYASIAGTLILAPLALYSCDLSLLTRLPCTIWLALLYLAIPGTVVALLFFYQGIESIGVVKAGIFINLIPVSTLLLSIPLLGERFSSSTLIGTAMVILGVFTVNRERTN